MKVLGVTGWSGAGKTTLLAKLIPELVSRGVRVSTMKHAHHAFDVDQPGKDSFIHRQAGASEVLIGSAKRWALMHELRDDAEPSARELMRHMTPVDLLLIEGFKGEDHEKMEVWREVNGRKLLSTDDATFVAVLCDGVPPSTKLPIINLNDVTAIADFVMRHCSLAGRTARGRHGPA
jgi:molybdopterin-guanine dinucleotide biosynthesis protein B